ncbi:nup53/35/40-type RNA recognition motif domain-containing protein [Phthorimaea operculella]|nr:nup53/35/40-type RNA recognition motif domain-containing protein [Phthorimaea operculella]
MPPRHAPPGGPKKNFDYSRLGKGPIRPPPLPANAANCSLEVKKVPRGLNDITHLNNHFSKFGKIVNIQVCYGGDPEGALITFSTPAEANVAYKSTEAVLNNRFIKVFWHNPENKQENQAPNNNQSKPVPRAANQHPLSNNKVLVNRVQPNQAVEAACAQAKQEEKIKAAEKAAAESLEEIKKENTPLPAAAAPAPTPAGGKQMEMRKRAQALLETQIQQQRLLINKLETGNVSGPARAALLSAINSAQEGIEKLRAELVAYNKVLRHAVTQQDETLARLSRLQLQEGQDVTELAKKIADLRRQMAIQFPHPAARRPHARGGRFSTTRINRLGPAVAPKVFNNQVVDHRPRALLVSGFEPEELDSLVAHFAQYGAITGKEVNLAVPELIVQYAARAHAEQALMRARHYNDRTLSITWVTGNKPIGSSAVTPVTTAPAAPATPAAQNGDAMDETKGHETPSASSDLLLEEEEDEDLEDRSWRR